MRRHMQSVRRRGGYLCIPSSGRQALLGHAGNIVSVNEIVSDAGMAWLKFEKSFQNVGSLLAVDVGVVIVVGCNQTPSIESGGFVVLGISTMKTTHRLVKCFDASVLVFSRVRIELAQRAEIIALTSRRRLKSLSSMDLPEALFAFRRIGRAPAPHAFRNTPVGH